MKRLLVVLSTIAVLLSSAIPAVAQERSELTATPLTPDEVIHANKSLTGRIAQSDPELLARSDRQPVNVMIKFDLDPVASYQGGVRNLAPTSPSATGLTLGQNRQAVRAYEQFLENEAQRIRQAIRNAVPAVQFGTTFTTVYGGVAAQLPARRAKDLLSLDGVAAVQFDRLEQPLTDVTPEFVGADQVWPSIGGSTRAGEGVIVGVLDTGIWPEHPSFADDHGLSHPGGSYACEFGDGLDPELGDPFNCNNKLIGAYAFLDTYMNFIGAEDGEYCNNATDECSARDSDGHGTHTASTAAGAPVDSAVLLGVERGPISGIAPGAHVIAYRVCLDLGCFQSDSVAAVGQAIADGAHVLNFSISGGVNAYADPVELAFLDAYAAGILVNASAGNSGPGAGTAHHAGPWTNTVGASTSDRHFFSTLELTGDGDATMSIPGVTVTAGIEPTAVIRGGDVPGYEDEQCLDPLPENSVTGMVVVCARGFIARVEKGYNVMQGGAAGFVLYNTALQGLNSDSHWLPSIHIEGPPTDFIAFLEGNSDVTASWVSGSATPVQGDVMAAFSSRGPVGDFIKPDVTSVGVQVLAGNTPTPISIIGGPPGELYQAIAGTSMSSPHAAGVAALVKAARPNWTPGQIKSAMMTSATQDVFKEDGETPSDPFDRGAGSVRANRAVAPAVTFDVSAADYFASAGDPMGRIHLNLPSINAPSLPGAITTTRTVRNVSGAAQRFSVQTTAPAGASISVSPSSFNLGAGAHRTLTITIDGTGLADGQYFGEIRLIPQRSGVNRAVLPVAFVKQPGNVALAHSCDPTTIPTNSSADCEVTVTNFAPVPAEVNLTVEGPRGANALQVRNFSDGTPFRNGFRWSGTLSPSLAPTIDSIAPPGPPFGYVPLSAFGVAPIGGVGDETIVNFNVDPFLYGAETYTRIGMVSNGYAVVGGGTSADVNYIPQTFPDPARPNNVLAPYWTDLNPAAGGALRATYLSDGTRWWLVLDWENVPIWTTGEPRSFQIWIQDTPAGVESITYAYGPAMGPGDPEGLTVGAENRDGTSGVNLGEIPSAGDGYTITTSPPQAGGSKTITYEAQSQSRTGNYDIVASMTSNVTAGTARKVVTITIE
jgi:subtilisin family serine protease